jgi:hypothetical protein
MLLAYLTLGCAFPCWVYRALRECAAYAGREGVGRTELTLLLLFPPYAVYVAVFRLPELIRAAQAQAGVPESAVLRRSYLFLNPCLFCALPLLAMAYQEALNEVWLAGA